MFDIKIINFFSKNIIFTFKKTGQDVFKTMNMSSKYYITDL